MMDTNYFLPIKSDCLSHYFGNAFILPSKYFNNKPIDIQNKFEDFLVICNKPWTQETDCSLELVLTKQEIELLIEVKQCIFLFPKPLPISRVKKVIFFDQAQKMQTVSNLSMSTAFIPDQLIEITEKKDELLFDSIEVPTQLPAKDWLSQVRRYDRFLGGFALMRLAGEDYMNYSENYFSTLSFFNEAIKYDIVAAGRNIDKRFHDAFVGESNFKTLFPFLNKVVDESDLYEVAKFEKQTITKDKVTRLIDLKNLEKATYMIAVLNTFGVAEEAKKKKIDGLILSNFKLEIKPETSEAVALCYGLNRGYAVFANKYRLNDREKTVKFELNSQVDYYTIESIYQYVFNDYVAEGFGYLDFWCPKLNNKSVKLKKADYQVLDTIVIGKKKPKVSSPEYLTNLLQRFFLKETEILFNSFIDKVRMTVYNDTIEEIEEELNNQQQEILRLRNDNARIQNLEAEIYKLKTESKPNSKTKGNTKASNHKSDSKIEFPEG